MKKIYKHLEKESHASNDLMDNHCMREEAILYGKKPVSA